MIIGESYFHFLHVCVCFFIFFLNYFRESLNDISMVKFELIGEVVSHKSVSTN